MENREIKYEKKFSMVQITNGVNYARFLAERGNISNDELNMVVLAKINLTSESGASDNEMNLLNNWAEQADDVLQGNFIMENKDTTEKYVKNFKEYLEKNNK
ncbi:MAG: hypothetical protein FJZ43_03125 [Candidatus Staskawiczbacteria bacterium]|nr:hypothetical protein [Candidatus Staskawiczbacteria bacterium]